MQTTFSTGPTLRRENNDVAGIGISFGDPAEDVLAMFGVRLRAAF